MQAVNFTSGRCNCRRITRSGGRRRVEEASPAVLQGEPSPKREVGGMVTIQARESVTAGTLVESAGDVDRSCCEHGC